MCVWVDQQSAHAVSHPGYADRAEYVAMHDPAPAGVFVFSSTTDTAARTTALCGRGAASTGNVASTSECGVRVSACCSNL